MNPSDIFIFPESPAKAKMKRSYPPSKLPKFKFADTLEEQLEQLKNNPIMRRFAQSRSKYANNRYRPIYHFVSPESTMNDPNGLCFWRGKWHLFYQGYPPEDTRVHWGHAVSDDLIHWKDLPYAIYPGPEDRCFSGATFVEENRVIAMYHGVGIGNMIATADDALLLNWKKIKNRAVIPIKPNLPYVVFDPCIWKKGKYYYALSGGSRKGKANEKLRANWLFRSSDLINWEYMHEFVENDNFSLAGDDGACPYFWPIGDRYILLHFSHYSGGKYLLGDYDKKRNKFIATVGGTFNHRATAPGAVHAPSATPDRDGGVIVIFNMNSGFPTDKIGGWNQIMTLPRRLTLYDRNILKIEPAGDIESLRGEHKQIKNLKLAANKEIILEGIQGDAMEILATIENNNADFIELNVLRAADKEEFTRIAFYPNRGFGRFVQSDAIVIDNSHSSISPYAVSRPPEIADVPKCDDIQDNIVKLRIFIDKSVVEVFVNDVQCEAVRVYPKRDDSIGVSICARGGNAKLKSLDAWQMRNIYSDI